MSTEGQAEVIDHSRPLPAENGLTHLSFVVSASLPGYDAPGEDRIRRATRLAVDLLQPLREILIREGLEVGEMTTRVSPWGAGFKVGKHPSRVCLYLTPYLAEDGQSWQAGIGTWAMSNLTFWKNLIGGEFKASPQQFEVLARVHAILDSMLKGNPAFRDICWNPTE